MSQQKKRVMKSDEIPDYVAEMIAAGCDICAVGHFTYVTGDMNPSEAARNKVERIGEKYGDRDPIRQEIATYLWSIGRYVEVASEDTRH